LTLGSRGESNNWGAVPGYPYPNSPNNGLYISVIYILENASPQFIRGKFPGVFAPVQSTTSNNSNHDSYINDFVSYSKTLILKHHAFGAAYYDIIGPWDN
jgi:hypothetical protein